MRDLWASLAGFDDFLLYFALSLLLLALFIAIYTRVTPYKELVLIQEGNTAAAVSLTGAVLGFVLPLASAVANSVNPIDMLLWGLLALIVQILVFLVARWMMPNIAQDIPNCQMASAIWLAALSLAAGILNAASMTY